MKPITRRRALQAALLSLPLSLVAAAPERSGGGGAAPTRAPAITGVLASVDAERGAFTLERVGADVDHVLREKMRERGGAKEGPKDKQEDGAPGERQAPGETAAFTTSAKAKIYIKFRSSPSVANNAERTLKDLEPMVGWPVSVKARGKADQQVAHEVIAWRGTPWNVRDK